MTTDPDHLWLPAPADLALSGDEMHVWSASLDVVAPRVQGLRRILTQDEVERAARFRFAEDRDRFIVARGLLRVILGRYLDAPPEQLQFYYGPRGKPALATRFGEDEIQFNLSHSHDLALFAITRNRRVGIDLECIRRFPKAGQLVERFFSIQERAVFRALSPDKQLEAFFRCWTRKEAYIKANGQGFGLALDGFDVSIAPGEPAQLLNVLGDPWEASRWSLCELLPAPRYVAALAAEGHDWRLSCWHWTAQDACGEEGINGIRRTFTGGSQTGGNGFYCVLAQRLRNQSQHV